MPDVRHTDLLAHSSVAVVGSGVAGLTAAWVASRTAEVTLFEADERLGGHADTHRVRSPEGQDLGIDTGFIVHNPRTYPTLLRLFSELGVQTQPSEMSLSVSDRETGVEWAGALGPRGLFPTLAMLGRGSHWRMLAEVVRFHRRARRLLVRPATPEADTTLRQFLADGGFSASFSRHFMEPLVAAVWSCDPATSLDYPARYLFQFLEHHGMLGVFGSPQWRTVSGGSATYVDRVAAGVQTVRTGTKVTALLETGSGVEVTDGNGTVHAFDAVVVATHPGEALGLLTEPSVAQREVLSALPYTASTALLHTDSALLPRAEAARSAWNFLRPQADDRQPGEVTVTYDLTRLQRLPTRTRYLVTLGGEHLVDPDTVIARREYTHPLYTPASVAAQRRLPEVDTDRVSFAGAYHGWGFHEDGARSGLAAVTRLGLPWPQPADTSAPPVEPGLYATTLRHTRRTPWHRSFTHRSHLWLVDLDHLPDHRALARFEARDHLGDPARSIRANLDHFLGLNDVELRGGRVLLATQPRSLGHCFNPISVFWCFDDRGRQAAVVVEVHNTYGDRHAYLLHPDDRGRARTDKQMYVSPFHGTDGRYEVTVPAPTDRLHLAVALHTDDGERFNASVTGERVAASPWRAAGATLRGAALIRIHGLWLWSRRLPVRPRPDHHQEGVR